mgnify:CR=1 FL=1
MNKNSNLKTYFDSKFNKEENYNKIMEKVKKEEKVQEKKEKRLSFRSFYVLAPVCLFILLLAGAFGFNFYNSNKVVSYLSIDINPSVMLGVNSKDTVKEVDNLNDDAKKLTEDLDLVGMEVDDATNKIIDKAIELGYINEEDSDNTILLSTYCDNKKASNSIKNKVNNSVNKNLNARGIRALIVDEELTVEDAQKANEYGVSEAKILFVKRALEENPDLEFEDLIYLPAKEIAKYISDYDSITGGKGQGNGNGSSQGQGNGSGSGQGQGNGSSSGQGQGNGDQIRKQDGTGDCKGTNCINQN